MKTVLFSTALLLSSIYLMGDIPEDAPVKCIDVNGQTVYSNNYRIDKMSYIDNTGKGYLRECSLYDIKMADTIKKSMR